jgi:hypothetical protein
MHERDLGAELGRLLDGFGPYDGRHTAAVFERLPARGLSSRAALALIGAGVVAAVVVTALLAPRWLSAGRGASPAAAPTARASASPTATTAPPALVLVMPSPVSISVRVDWSGHRLGPVDPPPGTVLDGPSPDGRLGLATSTTGKSYALFDTTDGHVVATLPLDMTGVMWSDDSRHLCGLASPGGQLVVVTVDPTRGVTGRRSFPVHVAGTGTTFIRACSAESDRAVLTDFWVVGRAQAAGDVEVLRLSTGATLLHQAFPAPAPFVNVEASPDGLFLAGWPLDGSQSTVVDLQTGRQVAHVTGVAMAFTADDRYLAVSSFVSEQGRPGGTGRLVDWRTGRTVWQDRGQLAIFAVEPDGDAIAVQLYGSDQEPPNHDVWLIVRPDGTTITLRRNGSGP